MRDLAVLFLHLLATVGLWSANIPSGPEFSGTAVTDPWEPSVRDQRGKVLVGPHEVPLATPTVPSPPSTPSVSSISVTGTAPKVGQAAQFTAAATLSNGTTQGDHVSGGLAFIK